MGRMRAGLTCLAALSVSPAAGDVAELVRRVPADVNTLIAIDGRALRATPLAAKPGGSPGGDPLRDIFNLPAGAEGLVLASRINFPEWSDVDRVALAEFPDAPPLAAVAAKERGYIEPIAGRPAAWLPRNVVATEVTRRIVAAMYPARRQAFTRWVSRLNTIPTAGPSPYLNRVVAAIGAGRPMALAIDLESTVAAKEAEVALRGLECLRGKDVDGPAIGGVLASIRGVTMTLRVTDAMEAETRVDFDRPIRPLGDAAGPMLREFLGHLGADLDGTESWAATLDEQSVTFRGPIAPVQVRRLLSVLEFPSQSISAPDEALPPKAEATPAAVAAMSKRYWDAVKGVQDELDAMKGTLRGRTRQSQALWYDRFAEKIDQLPVLDVDPDLAAFGSNVSQAYRSIGYRLRGVNLAYGYRRSVSDYGALTANQIRQQEATSAQDFLNVTLAQIDQGAAEMRRALTQKYRVQF